MMIVIPIVDGGLRMVPKCFEKGPEELKIRERIETIQTTELRGTACILRSVLDI